MMFPDQNRLLQLHLELWMRQLSFAYLWMSLTEPFEEADPQAPLLRSPGGDKGWQLIVIPYQGESSATET